MLEGPQLLDACHDDPMFLRFDPARYASWQHLDYPDDPWLRLYWKPHAETERGLGFQFISFHVASVDSDGADEPFKARHCQVNALLSGSAAYDGIRHLYIGTEDNDTEGYIHCPSLRKLQWLLRQLEDVVYTHCSHPTSCR